MNSVADSLSLSTTLPTNSVISYTCLRSNRRRHHHRRRYLRCATPRTNTPKFIKGPSPITSSSLLLLFTSPKSTATLLPKLSFHLHNIINNTTNNPCRFLRLANNNMSRPNSNKKFCNSQSLSDWLKPRLPSDSFASWGVKPGTKNVHNLWFELSEGETSLADSTPPVRTVEGVVVRVIGKDNNIPPRVPPGALKRRHTHPLSTLSEKMKPGESAEAAAFRAVKEELGSIIDGGFLDLAKG